MGFKKMKSQFIREDDHYNKRLHWFSSIFSPYLSYLLIRLKITADQGTILFFLAGLTGAFFFSHGTFIFALIGYIFWRLHIILDMCDGNIARYNKSYSIRGAYWDAMAHQILNPLYIISIHFSLYINTNEKLYLIISPVVVLIIGISMSVKNNFYKALFINNSKNEIKKINLQEKKSLKHKFYFILSEIFSLEGFLLFGLFSYYLESAINILIISLYSIFNLLIVCIKFYMYSYKGSVFSKN